MCMVSAPAIFQKDKKKVPDSIEEFKEKIFKSGCDIELKSIYFRDLLEELFEHIDMITEKFNEIFSENIFAQQTNYGDREEPHSSPLPHHRTYGSVYGDSAGQSRHG